MKDNTDYIYAGAATTLATHRLLSPNQREILLHTKDVSALRDAVRDTFFAPYIDEFVTLPEALDNALLHAKEYLLRIVHDGNIVPFFFLRYDYANAAHLLAAIAQNATEQDALSACSRFGMYAPVQLYKALQNNALRHIDEHLHEAVSTITRARHGSVIPYNAHSMLERAYIQRMHTMAHNTPLKTYAALQATLFNVRATLQTDNATRCVDGGCIETRNLHRDKIATALASQDSSIPWKQIVSDYETTGNIAAIDRALDDYHTKQLKQMAIAQDTVAPILLYIHTCIENVQYIRSIHTAHTVGLSSDALRAIIRTPAHAYAY
jgi:vacuolar-type H+-ATPase subunit C/Vma6